ncbi:MAG: LeuA family protein [Bacillota bacterium]
MITPEHLSPFNKLVLDQFQLQPGLILNDCTLREGEQAAEVNFSVEEKLEIARMLAAAGIRQVQGGYPGRSPLDMEAIRRMKEENLPIMVEAITQIFTPDWKEQIDAAIASGADIVDLMYPSSNVRLKYVQKVDRKEMLSRVAEAVRYAVGRGAIIRYAPTDSTRTELEFLKQVYATALDAGVQRISVADTAGAIGPAGLRYLVGEIVAFAGPGIPVQVHTHNDLGQGLANALAAAEAGATIIDGTLFGLGERSGNACLEEVAAALTIFYGMDLGVDLPKLAETARYVERVAQVPIHPSKPLLGRDAFAHKLDAHVMGVLANPVVYEPIPPEMVGNRRHFPLGKYAGPAVLKARLQQLGLNVSDDRLPQLKTAVERISVEHKRQITDEEIRQLAKEV